MSKLLFMIVGLLIGRRGHGVLRRTHPRLAQGPVAKEPPGPAARVAAKPAEAVCTGMVEAAGGEIDVFAQMPGELVEVNVREGKSVQKGQVVAVLDARRQEAEIGRAPPRRSPWRRPSSSASRPASARRRSKRPSWPPRPSPPN